MDTPHPEQPPATPPVPIAEPAKTPAPNPPSSPHADPAPPKKARRIIIAIAVIFVLLAATHWYIRSLDTVSTDDAYIDGHVTFVAPRVPGQVSRVLVDDNNRVHKGDLLVQLDSQPYVALVNIAKASVDAAQADVVVADSQAHATVGQMRSLRFNLEHTIEDVDNQIALLRSKIASLQSEKAALDKAQADYDRAVPLVAKGVVTQEEFDLRKEALEVAHARNEEALQAIYQVRVSLGLPPQPPDGADLAQVPTDLDQSFSSVRQAEASLMQAAAAIGVTDSFDISPKQMIANFYKRDPTGNIDTIYQKLIAESPVNKQALAKLASAQRNLDQAQLNLSYCDIHAEIDGVITRREVNPGNNVIAGQSILALRSLTEIWVNANFKETQLAKLRIGLPVDLDIDMYGHTQNFKGRISGFTMGTGSTLALLPAENATGNFVKVVQRLPVRIELTDYNPDTSPLFVGLSVTPHVHINDSPTGPDAGKILQPYLPPTTTPTTSPASN